MCTSRKKVMFWVTGANLPVLYINIINYLKYHIYVFTGPLLKHLPVEVWHETLWLRGNVWLTSTSWWQNYPGVIPVNFIRRNVSHSCFLLSLCLSLSCFYFLATDQPTIFSFWWGKPLVYCKFMLIKIHNFMNIFISRLRIPFTRIKVSTLKLITSHKYLLSNNAINIIEQQNGTLLPSCARRVTFECIYAHIYECVFVFIQNGITVSNGSWPQNKTGNIFLLCFKFQKFYSYI